MSIHAEESTPSQLLEIKLRLNLCEVLTINYNLLSTLSQLQEETKDLTINCPKPSNDYLGGPIDKRDNRG